MNNDLIERFKKAVMKIGTFTSDEVIEAFIAFWQALVKLKEKTDHSAGYYVPKIGEKYFYIASDIVVENHTNTSSYIDECNQKIGNSFETEEQAEHALKQKLAYGELVCLIHRLNKRENWSCEWEDPSELKRTLCCNYNNAIELYTDVYHRINNDALYFKGELFIEIVETLGEDKIKLALGFE